MIFQIIFMFRPKLGNPKPSYLGFDSRQLQFFRVIFFMFLKATNRTDAGKSAEAYSVV